MFFKNKDMDKRKEIEKIEFRIKALQLREKYNSKRSILSAIWVGAEIATLAVRAAQIAAQPIPKFDKGGVIVGSNNKEVIINKKGEIYGMDKRKR